MERFSTIKKKVSKIIWASWTFRFHPMSHECARASWTSFPPEPSRE
jgi:hypothetical protein